MDNTITAPEPGSPEDTQKLRKDGHSYLGGSEPYSDADAIEKAPADGQEEQPAEPAAEEKQPDNPTNADGSLS